MSHLYYMSLPNVGYWDRALTDAGAQLSPFARYLRTARDAALKRPPILAWQAAAPALAQRLDARLRRRFEDDQKRAAAGKRRRDRHGPAGLAKGVWVRLLPPPWNSEEPDATFEAFMSFRAEVHDRPPRPKQRGAKVLSFDREACCILLAESPEPIEPDPNAPATDTGRTYSGRLLFLGANTYALERQIYALDGLESRPHPRLAPLLGLAVGQARWDAVTPAPIGDKDWVFLDRPERDGTAEQREFVRRALATPDFAILEGPPGSGKTTAICELIAQLAKQKKRVMLVASTHVAVDNVLERLLEKQDASEDKFVLPVRIGDEENVASDAVKPWVFRRLKQTWKDDIQDFIDDPKGGTPIGDRARADLRGALAKSDGSADESPIIRLLLESANLVCGTTIGILQHPAIKAARDDGFEPFDVLILDEASKTPFAEFLVPAVHARRWVVVGDVRQLSPYVEEADLAENLRGLLSPDLADAAAYPFIASKLSSPRRPALVASASAEMSERLTAEAKGRDVAFVDLDRCNPKQPNLALLYADLVFGSPSAIKAFEHRLPAELVVTGGAVPDLPAWEAQRTALASKRKLRPEEEPVDWASEVAWRLIRSFELRQNLDEKAKYMKEIESLYPRTLGDEERAKLTRALDTIRRVSMPSILELLQRGFERLPDKPGFGVALTDGLPKPALAQRMVSLSYQHRMHPDISRFPREQFYSDGGAGDSGTDEEQWGFVGGFYQQRRQPAAVALLRDARTMAVERQWSYGRYKAGRATWMNVQPDRQRTRGNRNEAEVRRVLAELEAFVNWAASNPRRDRTGNQVAWEVGVLTFYRGQEALLCEALQGLSGLDGNTRNFQLPAGVPLDRRPVHVTLCTVDRFQGHEADLVLLSFVKSGSVGFLNSPNRLNVALTRARYQIVLVGHREFFKADDCRSPLLRAVGGSGHYPADLTWESKS